MPMREGKLVNLIGTDSIPQPIENPNYMTPRDQFAMAALGRLLCVPLGTSYTKEMCAADAYGYADAMMKERAK